MKKLELNILEQMKKLNKAMLKAKELEGRSVVHSRREVLEEAVITLRENPDCTLALFGVKNTEQINMDLVKVLQDMEGFLFHTIDKMSDRGRAIDIDLINPLTGRVMTGSSSGACVNILRGINDLAIGTDGGGSVLAPAMSTGLFSIMGKGLGLKGRSPRTSTDNINFVPGVGVISHHYELCKKSINKLCGIEDMTIQDLQDKKLKVAIPKAGSIMLPHGKDMRSLLDKVVDHLQGLVQFVEVDLRNVEDRNIAIPKCQDIFDKGIDAIITAEGPIEIYGTGDSVLGVFGEAGSHLQGQSGKYLLKVANMIDATAVSIPTEELAIGILIMGKKGVQEGRVVMTLGDIISQIYSHPPLFNRYFTQGYRQVDKGFF